MPSGVTDTYKSDALCEQRKRRSWACTLRAARQQESDSAEIQRLVDEGADGWQTTEKSVIGEAVHHCGGGSPLPLYIECRKRYNISE